MGLKTITDLNQIIRPNITEFKQKYAEASKAKGLESKGSNTSCPQGK